MSLHIDSSVRRTQELREPGTPASHAPGPRASAGSADSGLAMTWPPAQAAATARLAEQVASPEGHPSGDVEGAVTTLSPYLSHGILTPSEVLATLSRHQPIEWGRPIERQHSLLVELGWREYAQHVAAHRGDDVAPSVPADPLPEQVYAVSLPADLRGAKTGVPAVDQAVRMLYRSGWLPHQGRLLLASYLVHLRKVHWRSVADWMLSHLLEADLASTDLTCQWVAGALDGTPRLFNDDALRRWAPPGWHSPGSCIDTSLEALRVLAHVPRRLGPDRSQGELVDSVDEPGIAASPAPELGFSAPFAGTVAGRHVWLMHPWALRAPPTDLPSDTVVVGLCLQDWHQRRPWSQAHWTFVARAMATFTRERWYGGPLDVAHALRDACSVQTTQDPQLPSALACLAQRRPAARLFADVDPPCDSFAQWWARVTQGVPTVHDLPGLQPLSR